MIDYTWFKTITFAVALTCVATASFARPPSYGDGTATQDKIQYCSMLVNRFGHKSQSINSGYYGIGVDRPNPNRWKIRIKNPGWFSDSLFINFEQTTKEQYEDYEHVAYCHWSQDAPWFEFVIGHFHTRGVALCYAYAFIPEHICP
jgi:hypothetical protein